MHPFIVQSIAAERARDLLKAAQRNRDAVPARERAVRQRRLPGTAGIARRLGFSLTSGDAGHSRLLLMTISALACTCLATGPGQARVRGRGEMPG
jgi:hypothetical protein